MMKMSVLDYIRDKQAAVIVLDIANFQREGIILPHATFRKQLLDLAATGERMRWISVKDRLPEHETDVDIFIKIGVRRANVLFTNYEEDPHFYWEEHDCIYELDEVTHWMPLPELPKEGAEYNEQK
jgi:hypothetical protein